MAPAFASPSPLPSRATSVIAPRSRPSGPVACAAHPAQSRAPAAPARSTGGAKRRLTVRAPVLDTRIESVSEAHHWLAVSSATTAVFERAAVAQADELRKLESSGALTGAASHRWVLRAAGVEDEIMADEGGVCRYVVMETFGGEGGEGRWLGGMELVGKTVQAEVQASLRYRNVFTSKLHDSKFDVNKAVVVVESMQAKTGKENIKVVREGLEAAAEAAVVAGDCLEFCVLEAACENGVGLFKTIEVYESEEKRAGRLDLDAAFVEATKGAMAAGKRTRSMFKPVVFA